MTMHLTSPLFDKIRIAPRIGAKIMGEQMCAAAGMDPDVVRKQQYRGPVANRELDSLRMKIAARMLASNLLISDITSWFEGYSAETIYRWAREAKNRENA